MEMPPARAGRFILFVLLTLTATVARAQNSAQFDALIAAHEHGLTPADYNVARLAKLATNLSAADRFDDRLQDAFLRYAADVARGRLSPDIDPDWHIPPPSIDELPTIDDIAGLPPPHADYRRLHDAMRRYEAIRTQGGWAEIPPGPVLSVGMRDPDIAIARDRLRRTGDYDPNLLQADSHMFDAGLDAAVRRFQARHALRVDGRIDAATRAAMNVPVDARIEQLAVAMERWRWLPRELGARYVWVNTAEAILRVIDTGRTVLSMRAIVGHSTRPTPSLQGNIRRIVFNPTWSVPVTIATEDLLPKLRRDRDFLARNGFRVFAGRGEDAREIAPADVDWAAVDPQRFGYRFVQQPGPVNSLGRIKIAFDNPFDIYIHDTPSKGLFGLRTRAFSSGCVRLEKAAEFAAELLAGDPNGAGLNVQRALDQPDTRGTTLARPVPIYIVYITSWVTADGQVHFRRDLYQRDAPVAAALRGGGNQPPS